MPVLIIALGSSSAWLFTECNNKVVPSCLYELKRGAVSSVRALTCCRALPCVRLQNAVTGLWKCCSPFILHFFQLRLSPVVCLLLSVSHRYIYLLAFLICNRICLGSCLLKVVAASQEKFRFWRTRRGNGTTETVPVIPFLNHGKFSEESTSLIDDLPFSSDRNEPSWLYG